MKRRNWFNLLAQSNDIFGRTRVKLTLFYSVILTIFLFIFIAVVLFLFHRMVSADQKESMVNFLSHEQEELEVATIERGGAHRFEEKFDRKVFLSDNQMFYYVLDDQDQLLISNETYSGLQELLINKIKDWDLEKEEFKRTSLIIPANNDAYGIHQGEELDLLILAKPVDTVPFGEVTMYVGVDITYFQSIFKWAWLILCGLAVLFVGIAIGLSSFMAKRALIPIQTSFQQQREFVANASHELRTPLSVILSSAEALELEEQSGFSQKLITRMKSETNDTINE